MTRRAQKKNPFPPHTNEEAVVRHPIICFDIYAREAPRRSSQLDRDIT